MVVAHHPVDIIIKVDIRIVEVAVPRSLHHIFTHPFGIDRAIIGIIGI